MKIANFHDLLAVTLVDENPELCVRAVENCLLPITSGIEAIGALMSSLEEDYGLSHITIRDVGHLLTFLANASLDLQHMHADANFMLRKKLAGAGEEAKA